MTVDLVIAAARTAGLRAAIEVSNGGLHVFVDGVDAFVGKCGGRSSR
jgi:hypothetical protein